MKKLLSILAVFCLALVIASCNGHTHDYSAEWATDEESHWHVCAGCDERIELGAHEWDLGKVTKEPSGTKKGTKEFSCKVCKKTKVETFDNVLSAINGKNNDAINITAVIFGLTTDGFYAADATAGVYVKLSAANIGVLSSLKVGSEVEITGKLGVTNSQPFVKNANAKVLAEGKTEQKAVEADLATVTGNDANVPASYGKLYSVSVVVSLDEANRMVWTDDTGSILIDSEVAQKLQDIVGKKVVANIVLTSKDASGTWMAYVFAETIQEKLVNIDDVKDVVFENTTLEEEVYGLLNLPTSYKPEPSVKFTWAVKSGKSIAITNNEAVIDIGITQDERVVLELTISSGETKATKDYEVTVKAIRALSIADAKNTTDEFILVNGLVVARGTADEKAAYSYIIMMDEETKELILVSVTGKQVLTVTVGDRISVVAKYVAMNEKNPEYLFLSDIKSLNVNESGVAVNYAELNAARLETEEDYQDAIDNHHNEIRLYKIVNPYMVGSGSSSYSWQQFGPTKAAAKDGLINSRQFSLLIANFSINGLNTWEETFQVPKKNEGAKAYPGTVMYVYSVYQTGATKWSFIIPNESACLYELGEAIKDSIKDQLELEINATTAGTYTLPSSVTHNEVEYQITWASLNEAVINSKTGAYPQLDEDTLVDLTGTITVDGKQYSVVVTVKVIAATVEAISVSEAIAAGSGDVKKLEAFVAAIGCTSGSSKEFRDGIMITDGRQVIYYDTTDYTVDEHTFKTGDKIVIKNAKIVVDADGNTLTGGTITLESENNTIDYSNLQIVATITNNEELAAFVKSHKPTRGLVVKFVGPMNFVGTGSKSDHARYQVNYKAANSSPSARYAFADTESGNDKDGRTLSFSMPASKLLLQRDWWEECGMPEKSGSKSYEVIGSFYAVGGSNGATMQAWTFINAEEFSLTVPTAEYLIGKELEKSFVTKEISAGSAGQVTLPTNVNVGGIDYPLSWESSNPEVMMNTGEYVAVKANTKVTLTAKFMTDSEHTWSVELELKAKEVKVLTISEVAALEDGVVEAFTAIVAGYASGNGGTVASYPSTALYLTDGLKVMAIDTFAGEMTLAAYVAKAGDAELSVGDIITVYGVTKKGNSLECNDATTAEKTGVKEGNAWFNPTVAEENIIDSSEDLAAYLKTIDKTGKKEIDIDEFKVYKLVGTQENPLYINTVNSYFLTAFYKNDTNKDGEKITAVAGDPGFTVKDGKYCYFGFHTGSILKAVGDENWCSTNLPITNFTHKDYYTTCATVKSNKALFDYGFVGSVYVIFSYSGSANYPYIYHGMLGAGFDLTRIVK